MTMEIAQARVTETGLTLTTYNEDGSEHDEKKLGPTEMLDAMDDADGTAIEIREHSGIDL